MNTQAVENLDLSPKDAKFVRAYIRTGDHAKAAHAAGSQASTPESLRVVGYKMAKRLNGPIKALMAAAGLTSVEILRRVAQGLDASDQRVALGPKGAVHEFESPNWPARARFTDMAIKLSGGYPKAQLELPFDVGEDGKLVITAEFETGTNGV